MTGFSRSFHCGAAAFVLYSVSVIVSEPAAAFCVRNDIGAPIQVQALDGTANFTVEIENNKKACCKPKDAACGIGEENVKLSITAGDEDAVCDVSVDPKGNVNVTGKPTGLKCKSNKAGSTMDWAPG